jgi:membrane protein DedA with SNARE-associated domain
MQSNLSFSGGATALASHLGVAGAAVGVLLNSLGVPGLSEVLLPLSGVAVRQGDISWGVLLVACVLAQLVGLTASYLIARYGGLALVQRYGKYVLISHRDIMAAHRLFQKHGSRLVVVGAFTPGIQGFIGYVAGLAAMNYWRFLVSAALGKLVWTGGLIYLGYALGNHLELIDRSIKQIGVVVLAGLVAAIVWYIVHHRRADHEIAAAKQHKEKH